VSGFVERKASNWLPRKFGDNTRFAKCKRWRRICVQNLSFLFCDYWKV